MPTLTSHHNRNEDRNNGGSDNNGGGGGNNSVNGSLSHLVVKGKMDRIFYQPKSLIDQSILLSSQNRELSARGTHLVQEKDFLEYLSKLTN